VPTGNVLVTNARWLAPDQFLVIGTEPSHGVRAYVVGSNGASAPRAITPERVTFFSEQVALSHDRRTVAFRSPDGVMTLYHTDGSAASTANGFGADEMPIAWTGDDRSLLLMTNGSPRQLAAVEPTSGKRTLIRTMVSSNRSFGRPSSMFLTPDGRSYVVNYQRQVMTLFS
jgi:hypothetical protein